MKEFPPFTLSQWNWVKDNLGLVSIKDGANLDAFQRLRVSEPETLFDLSHLYDKQPLFVEELTASGGTGTHVQNTASVDMAVTTTIGSRVVRQTKQYFNYQPGKSMLILCTGVMPAEAGVRARVGLFDDDNDKSVDSGGDGVYFENNGADAWVGLRSYVTGSQVDTITAQADWNIDPMDGTGPSGVTVDWEQSQIFLFDLEWLGVGRVRYGLVIDGKIYYVHEALNANNNPNVYMRRASLPVRYEIEQIDGTGTGTLKHICSTVISEGGHNPDGRVFAYAKSSSQVVNAETAVLSIRFRSGYERGQLFPLDVSTLTQTNDPTLIRVYYGTSLTSPSWVTFDSTNSGVEYDISATGFSGGRLVSTGYSSNQARQGVQDGEFSVPGVSIAGTPEIVTVTIQGLAGNATVYGGISWREVL